MSALPFRLLPDTAAVGDDGWLTIGGCSVSDLVAEFGTPLFVYDEAHLRARCREVVAAFGPGRAVYASKAFLSRAMARLVYEEGMGLDVATGGELYTVLSAGVPASACVFHGNNKSSTELAQAIEAGIGRIIVDSFDELDRLDAFSSSSSMPEVLIRVTPGVAAHTHDYVTTGQDDSKFGFNLANGDADRAIERARDTLNLIGVHCHIGSNVFDASSFGRALEVMAPVVDRWSVAELVIGGGLGVAYVAGEHAATITEWGQMVSDQAQGLGLSAKIGVEPGRAIVAGAAITVYTLGTIKNIPGIRTYFAVDGGMSDNPRPVLYGSGYEAFLPRAPHADRTRSGRIVGKHCESGDVLVHDAWLPADTTVADLVATPVTGAYGRSMGSNYNAITRPPVVFVADGEARLVIRRETYDDLTATDMG